MGREGWAGNSGRDLGRILGTTFDSQDPEFLEFPSAAPAGDRLLQAPPGNCWDGKQPWELQGMGDAAVW